MATKAVGADKSTTSWDVSVGEPSEDCRPEVPIPEKPSEPECGDTDAPHLPDTSDKPYSWSDDKPAGESGQHTLTATTKHGYVFADGKTTHSYDVDVPDSSTECPVSVDVVAPSIVQPVCAADGSSVQGSFTLPASTEAITYSSSGTTITATAASGYTLNAAAGWTLSHDRSTATYEVVYNSVDCPAPVSVTPVDPTVVQPTCSTGGQSQPGSYTIASTTGVVYLVNGVETASGTYPGPIAGATVTARAAHGYVLTNPAWSYSLTVDPTPECGFVVVVPVDPTVVQPSCLGGQAVTGSYTIPSTAGVDYLVDGVGTAAGTYPGAGLNVTVTAQAQQGYQLSDPNWSYRITLQPELACVITVTPVNPTVVDASYCADGSYTIASTPGIEYLIDGEVTAAGTYAGPINHAVVTARALEGYQLSDSEWSFILNIDEATCPVVVPVTPVDPTVVQPSCSVGGTAVDGWYSIPKTEGIVYMANGVDKPAGKYSGPVSGVTITARAVEPYLDIDPTWSYRVDIKAATSCVVPCPTAADCVPPCTGSTCLPHTGSNASQLALIGSLALLFGLGLVGLGRRPRVSTPALAATPVIGIWRERWSMHTSLVTRVKGALNRTPRPCRRT